ncbi:MAG: phosphoribosylaminoimidazole carboxylase [Geminicoccaceae bacterium]|nr:phosphoribosylaminoimidazole carboxylase [Geminicoccaceae bacterium]
MRLAPGACIGVMGGGQLGRMTALAAARLGYRCHVFAPEPDGPAAQVTNRVTVAAYDDPAALERFAAAVDVVTIEFENLPVAPLARLAGLVPVRPAPAVLAICQDRLREKAFLTGIGVATAPWRPVQAADELARAQAELAGPLVLKTARLGYDGKGQIGLAPEDDPAAAWDRFGQVPGIAEARVDFACEVSVITARGEDGSQISYPAVENRHRAHVLAQTIAPARIGAGLAAEARAVAERIARELELVGLLAVEMFVTQGQRLLVNELAPRPHNSGHWTIDACAISQFELLIRAICGLPLPDPGRFADAVMDNLLGPAIEAWPELLAEPGARLHLYGKDEVRAGRKLGHVTRLTRWI